METTCFARIFAMDLFGMDDMCIMVKMATVLYFRAIACLAWPDPSLQSSLGTLRNHRLHNSQIMLSLSEKSGLTRSAAGRH